MKSLLISESVGVRDILGITKPMHYLDLVTVDVPSAGLMSAWSHCPRLVMEEGGAGHAYI